MTTRRLDLSAYKLSDSDSSDDDRVASKGPPVKGSNEGTATAAPSAGESLNNTVIKREDVPPPAVSVGSPVLGASTNQQLSSKPSLAQLLNRSVNNASIGGLASSTTQNSSPVGSPTAPSASASETRRPTLTQLMNRDTSSANLKATNSASRLPNLSSFKVADSDSDSEGGSSPTKVEAPAPPHQAADVPQPKVEEAVAAKPDIEVPRPVVGALDLRLTQRSEATKARNSHQEELDHPAPDPLDATLGRMTESEGAPSAGPSTARGALTPKMASGRRGGRNSLNVTTNNRATSSLDNTQTVASLNSTNLVKNHHEHQLKGTEGKELVTTRGNSFNFDNTLNANHSFNAGEPRSERHSLGPLGVPIAVTVSDAAAPPLDSDGNSNTARPCDSPCFEDFKGDENILANASIRPGSAIAGHRPASTAPSHVGGNRFDDEDRSSVFGDNKKGKQSSSPTKAQGSPSRRKATSASPQRQRGGAGASPARSVPAAHAANVSTSSTANGPNSSAGGASTTAFTRGTTIDGQTSKHSTATTGKFFDPEATAAVAAIIPLSPTHAATAVGPSPAEMAAYSPHKRSTSKSNQRMFHDPRMGETVTSPMRLANPTALTIDEKKGKIERERTERYEHFLEVREREELVRGDKEQARHIEAQATLNKSPMRFKSPMKLSAEEKDTSIRREVAFRELLVQQAREEQRKTRRDMVEELKEIEAASHEVTQPPMRFGDTWTSPADEYSIQQESQRRAMERQTALTDEGPSFQRTTTSSRVNESTTLETRKQLGNIMLTEEEYNEIQKEEERKARKKASNQNFMTSYASRGLSSTNNQPPGTYPPNFSRFTKAQKSRLVQEPPPPPKRRLLPGGHVKVSERLLQSTTAAAGKKNDIVAYLESIQVKHNSWSSSPTPSSRVASISAAPGYPAEGYSALDHSHNHHPIIPLSTEPYCPPPNFEDAAESSTMSTNIDSITKQKRSTPRTTAAMERRAEVNRAKVERMKREEEQAEKKRLAPKKDGTLLSFERLQSSLSGVGGSMRFT